MSLKDYINEELLCRAVSASSTVSDTTALLWQTVPVLAVAARQGIGRDRLLASDRCWVDHCVDVHFSLGDFGGDGRGEAATPGALHVPQDQ